MDLPRSQVLSVAKSAITEKVNITPTAQEMLNTSTQIFISYLTATAATRQKGQKTMQVKDVEKALHDMEWEAILPQLRK